MSPETKDGPRGTCATPNHPERVHYIASDCVSPILTPDETARILSAGVNAAAPGLDDRTLDAVIKLRTAQAEHAEAEAAYKAAEERRLAAWHALLAVQEETAAVLGLPVGDDR